MSDAETTPAVETLTVRGHVLREVRRLDTEHGPRFEGMDGTRELCVFQLQNGTWLASVSYHTKDGRLTFQPTGDPDRIEAMTHALDIAERQAAIVVRDHLGRERSAEPAFIHSSAA